MKKILLSFVLLLACVGVWAQTVVTKVTPGKMYTMECQPNDGHSTRFISDNGTVINGRSAEGTYLVLEEAEENQYYIKSLVSGKYIYFTEDNKIAVSLEKPTKAWTFDTGSSGQGAYVTFSNGGTRFLNNNGNVTTGGTENLQLANHSNKPGGKPDGTNYCSQWRLHEYDYVGPISDAEIPSGFYRLKHIVSGRYLYAPEDLPTEATEDNTNFKATFSAPYTEDASDNHRDIWYIENMGKDDYLDSEKNNVIYRIWCFQGGYGLATNPNPSVYGSFDARNCPRLYNLTLNDKGYYTIAGHVYDKTEKNETDKNVKGLFIGKGAIGESTPLKPSDANFSMLARKGNASNSETWWAIIPVETIAKPVTIGSIGVGTFAFNSDVQIPEGIEAYVATERGERIGLTKLEGTIPARMGVVLRKTESKNDFTFEAVHGLGIGMKAVGTGGSETSVEDKGNLLVGTLAETSLDEGDYILAVKKNTENEVVFGRISEGSNIASNKAYLPAEAVSQTRGFYTLMWGDVETGIEEIQSAVQKDGIFVEGQQIVIVKNGLKYNAKGQRVK